MLSDGALDRGFGARGLSLCYFAGSAADKAVGAPACPTDVVANS